MAPAVLLPSENSDDVVLFMDGDMWGGSRGEDGFTVGNEELPVPVFATATFGADTHRISQPTKS